MIDSRRDLKFYIKEDQKANLGFNGICVKYLKLLRKTEFHFNCKHKIRFKIASTMFKLLSIFTGIYIPINTFGYGLGLFHYGAIVVNPTARFGNYCVIQNCVNVAANVCGGDYIYLAPGAKINENKMIADHVIIGTNAVVTHDCLEKSSTYAGVPARKISEKGFYPNFETIDNKEGS